MAILESCCGRGLTVSCTVVGIYLLVAYVVAFAIDLWWILESPAAPPIPVYLLCLGYFILFTSSVLLLHGLSMKKTTFLLVWLFMMGIFLGPEAGLVLYLSIHYWRVTSLYGLIEVTCWACRIVVNAIGLLCVQSLHSIWREEKTVLLRLETLKATSLSKSHGRQSNMPSVFRAPEKKNILQEETQEKSEADTHGYLRTSYKDLYSKNEDDYSYVDAQYAEEIEFSEFNASSFDPTVIDARLENMPYLTIRKKPKQMVKATELFLNEKGYIPKTRSLIDFREADFYQGKEIKHSIKQKPNLVILKKDFQAHANQQTNENTNSLDRKIIKNKNLKILKKLSPFYNKKPVKVNIYKINPPENFMTSKLDFQLNKIYSNRGMYTFDEKIRKIIYYPPAFFDKSIKFRSRMDSYGSSHSRSSIDTDSEEIRHISDVAL